MPWKCYKLVLQSESDICIGYQKLGFVQRTRYYIPARNLWASLTESMTLSKYRSPRPEDYVSIGTDLETDVRFSYFYVLDPATQKPIRPFGPRGTAEDPDRFERKFIHSSARTAIAPQTESAETGALFEVEYIVARRHRLPTLWLGYVFIRELAAAPNWLDDVKTHLSRRIAVGGERRHGMGLLRLHGDPVPVSHADVGEIFGCTLVDNAEGDDKGPLIAVPSGSPFFAHVQVRESVKDDGTIVHLGCEVPMQGDIEPFTGRITKSSGHGHDFEPMRFCWTPGSMIPPSAAVAKATFRIGGKGVLEFVESVPKPAPQAAVAKVAAS